MAVSGAVKLEVIAQAQENIRAVLKQSNAAIRKTSDELKRADKTQGKMGKTIDFVKGKALALKASFIAVGAAAAAAAVQQLAAFTKEGAVMADQVDAVRGRVANLDEVIRKTQEATTGIVDEAAIVKSVALFDAFGLELSLLPGLMEQASKTSLRTGESVDFLVESLVKGVARMSPAILDNAGLQVNLAGATEEAAKMFGVQAEALTSTQQKAGMLSLVLEKLGEQNKDIDLNNSRVASMQRLEVEIRNVEHAAKVGLANAFLSVETSIGNMAGAMSSQLAVAVSQAGRMIDGVISDMHDAAKKAIKVDAALEKLALTNRARQFEEKALAEETAKIQARTDRAKLDALKRLKANLKAGVEETDAQIMHTRELNRIRNAAESDMKKAGSAAKKRAEGMLATERKTLETIQARREETLRQLDAVRGVTAGARQIKALEAEIATLDEKRATAKEGELEALTEQIEANEELILVITKEEKATDSAGAARKRVTKEVKANVEELLAVQLFENKLAMTGTDVAKARLVAEQKRKELRAEMLRIGKHDLADEYERARLAGIQIELDAAEKAARKDQATDESNSLEIARLTLQIAREKDELSIIDLDLQRQILEIKDRGLSTDEESLALELAKLEAETQRGEVAQFNREQLAETLGEGFGGAFAEGASLLQEMDATLDELNRPKRFDNVIAGFNQMSRSIPEASRKFAELGKSSLSSGEQVAAGVSAGLGAIGPSVAAFVSGTTEKALVMGAFSAAMAVASAFTNPAESASHAVAAGMFFAMAGVSASMPTTAVPEAETVAAGGGLVTPAATPEEQEAQRITVNLGPGMLLGLPQDLGRAISDQINSMAGTGMEATAF